MPRSLESTGGPEETLKFLASRRGDQNHQWLLFRDRAEVFQPGEVRIISDSPQVRRAVFGNMGGNPSGAVTIAISVIDKSGAFPPLTSALMQRGNVAGPPLVDVPAIHLVDPGNLKTPLHEVYTTVAQRGLAPQAIDIVKTLIPAIDDVQILTEQNKPTMYIFSKDGSASAWRGWGWSEVALGDEFASGMRRSVVWFCSKNRRHTCIRERSAKSPAQS